MTSTTNIKEVTNGEQFGVARVCHICRGKLSMGEKYIWFYSTRGYANICYKCMIYIGELGKSLEQENDDFLKQDKKARENKFKMMLKIKQGQENNNGNV